MKAQNARLTGFLFLLPLLAYGVGSGLLESAMKQPDDSVALLWTGILLVMLNSVTVVVLGARLFPVLKQHKQTAVIYVFERILEAILLLIGLFVLVNSNDPKAAKEAHFLFYQPAMLILGVGSSFCCISLFRLQRLPAWLAIFGCIGYTLLAIGSVAELLGLPIGILLSLPGGLFEIALGVRLIAKGWKQSPVATG